MLRTLGGRARVQIAGMYRPEELIEHIAADRLTHRWLRFGYLTADGEEWLHTFPNLRTLVLPKRLTGVLPRLPERPTITRVAGRAAMWRAFAAYGPGRTPHPVTIDSSAPHRISSPAFTRSD